MIVERLLLSLRPIRHWALLISIIAFFENWYQQSRDSDFPLIVQFFDFVKGFKGRSSGRKVQDPVLSFFHFCKRISREISGYDSNYIFCTLHFSAISPRFRLVSFYSNFPAAARVHIFVTGEKNCRNTLLLLLRLNFWGYSLIICRRCCRAPLDIWGV